MNIIAGRKRQPAEQIVRKLKQGDELDRTRIFQGWRARVLSGDLPIRSGDVESVVTKFDFDA
ncbi:hypothetical protein RHOER0001_5299 [Rhodococcus erythropolis SK121]|nr:hypothetical protein RHOER0001_5299 [Rhodococcus erythropolis SK121]